MDPSRKENKSEISLILWICRHMNDPKVELHCVLFYSEKDFTPEWSVGGLSLIAFKRSVRAAPLFHAKKANGLPGGCLCAHLKMPRNQKESGKVPI